MIGDREDSEAMFLHCVLRDNGILLEAKVTAEMFTTYRGLFSKTSALIARGQAKLSDLMREANDRETQLLAPLAQNHSTNWQGFEAKIITAWSTEKFHDALRDALDRDLNTGIETVEKAIMEIATRRTPAKTSKLSDLMLPVITKISEGGHAKGIPFGFPLIDNATMGAKASQLIIVGARPSQGKSALMTHLIRNMGRESKPGLITIESADEEIALRILAGEARIDSRLLMAGKVDEPGERRKLAHAGLAVSQWGKNVSIHDQPGISLTEVHSVCRRMAKDGADVIFIDYLQLIRAAGFAQKWEEVAEVCSGLKAIARELKIPLIALAQLRRDADDKRPGMGDIQHSSAAEQFADQVWLIYHKRDKEGKLMNSRIILEKVRDGQTRDVLVDFERNTMNFFEREDQKE